MSAALHSIVRLMPFNWKVEQIESRTASWNGLCSTFDGPPYIHIFIHSFSILSDDRSIYILYDKPRTLIQTYVIIF
jgi:hypothetical protein